MKASDIVVYISGAYTPYRDKAGVYYDTETNIAVAEHYQIKLMEEGFAVHCPHKNTAHFETKCKLKYEEYLELDFTIMKRCDCVFKLFNYKRSHGAQEEVQYAASLDMPIFDDIDDLKNYYKIS